MQLFYSAPSPYARKARIVVREKGLLDDVIERECNPFIDPAELRAVNPLGKVPTLATDTLALYDSVLICEYLDALGEAPKLVPIEPGERRWRVLRGQALGDGVLDLAVSLTLERRRAQHERSRWFRTRWESQIATALDAMQDEIDTLPPTITLAAVTFVAALGYLDFRHPALEWRSGRTALADWYEQVIARSSLADTVPAEPSGTL